MIFVCHQLPRLCYVFLHVMLYLPIDIELCPLTAALCDHLMLIPSCFIVITPFQQSSSSSFHLWLIPSILPIFFAQTICAVFCQMWLQPCQRHSLQIFLIVPNGRIATCPNSVFDTIPLSLVYWCFPPLPPFQFFWPALLVMLH